MPPRPKKHQTVPELALRIRELRESRKESQTQLAAVLGTLPSAISKWEAGRNRPSPDVFVRLARISDGAMRQFFLAQAGIGFKEEGSVDFNDANWARRARERAALVGEPREFTAKADRSIAWDPDLLRFVMKTIDDGLKKRNMKLLNDKYIEAVILAYEHCHRIGERDADMIDRLLKVA